MSVHGYCAVTAFCCLFCVNLGLCMDVSPSLRFFSVISPSAWCLSVITDGHASSDWSPGPMFVDVHLGVICVVIGSFLICFSSLCFYVFFLIRKGLFISVLSQHSSSTIPSFHLGHAVGALNRIQPSLLFGSLY